MRKHYRLIVLGGGAGGISTASRILSKKKDLKDDVLIIEPGDYHYFQPAWPLVGSGEEKLEATRKPTEKVIPKGARWMQAAVENVDPIKREVTADGTVISYDYLIVALGIELNYDAIKGAKEFIGTNSVCTNYLYDYVEYTYESLKNTKTGNIIVTKPRSKIKGGVSAENSLFTMDDFVKQHDRNVDIAFRSGRNEIFEVKKYNDSLISQMEEKHIDYKLNEELIEVKGDEKLAVFKNTQTGETHTAPFEMIVITPPMHGPSVLKNSGLLNEDGWVDVDKHTMMHNKYTTVFSLGDSSSLPTVKMGGAVRKQLPVLVDNLIERMNDQEPSHKYDGRTACPIATEYGELILVEFGYDRVPTETTFLNQADDKKIFYQFKKNMLPIMYWYAMLNGKA
ncbi:pyridine nucleotide-disulfide oxidoreductase [Jeotgalicoccus coquinae]|uniref:Sulfide dehydrogenase [flavocytochrome c] flavoprotein chain n=1 Tax=Jeotgalicoccus coquinae TaxID=709509 RepID=A0A6V7R1R2_9STAP|nr:FAD/NAD(P)-binding oxidoreductase [Jeotgalicoccus coquinae]MBB6423623.1 sulfide:quinone oxidoreductase [Jeotgalicoccus coquinae]GGE21301.1 pyridine nucleotide-disulfide oxidoreductase [Jeotgalicoccus coquinae]CAD2071276.1 Sulfide dehydrogenase [flavocytochrome c] flavoprotein chain precursor [Jeotgalicoccus coquinae]